MSLSWYKKYSECLTHSRGVSSSHQSWVVAALASDIMGFGVTLQALDAKPLETTGPRKMEG